MAILSRSGGDIKNFALNLICDKFLIVCHSPLSRTPSHPYPPPLSHTNHIRTYLTHHTTPRESFGRESLTSALTMMGIGKLS